VKFDFALFATFNWEIYRSADAGGSPPWNHAS